MSANAGLEAQVAALATEIRALRGEVQQMREDVLAHVKDHEERLRSAEAKLIRLDHQVGLWTGLLVTLDVALSSVATWLAGRLQ